MTEVVQSFGEQVASRTESRDRSRRERMIRASIEAARKAEVRNDYEVVREMLVEYLAPQLVGRVSERRIRGLADEVGEEYDFHGSALLDVLDAETIEPPTLDAALRSLESVAMARDIISAELRNFAPGKGFALPMGTVYKSTEYNIDGSVQLISYHAGETKTLYHGETGEGKSTAMSNEVADRWYATCTGEWHDGRRKREDAFKIVDVIDMDVFENAVYDIPQSQDALRDVRRSLDLPTDYTDIDDFDRPGLEVMVPLTSDLEGREVPTNTETGETVVRPFTIAASDLTKRTLQYFVAGSTDQQQSIIGMAYDRVEYKHDDWRLEDLGEELLQIDGASDSFKERALNKLIELQRAGFIRDKECEHRLDWKRIFNDAETITSFSQAFLREPDQKLMVLSYLFYSMYWERVDYSDLPNLLVVGRELHEATPHNQENNGPEQEQSLRKAMVGEMSYIMRKNRKHDVEIMMDTQDITDLKRGTRKRFNRAVTFQSHDDAMEELFGKVAGDKSEWREYSDSIQTSQVGEGTVIGKTELNDRDGSSFIANVQFAPPPWHVFDDDYADDGLHERVRHLDEEEYQPHGWDVDLPEDYMFTADELRQTIAEENEENENGIPVEHKRELHREEARRRRRMGESIRQIRENIADNPETGNDYSKSTVHGWVEDIDPNNPNDALA